MSTKPGDEIFPPAIVLDTVEPPFSSINKLKGKSPFGAIDRNRLYLSQLSGFKVKRSIGYFDRRVTCIEWHPSNEYPTVMALGSKGGDICWFDFTKNPEHKGSWENVREDQTKLPYIYGQGAGGSITSMRFNPFDPTMIFTTSIDGTVKQQDFEGKQSVIYLDTLNKDKWFTAIDISASRKIIAIGSNYGQIILKDFNGKDIYSKKLHKSKCHDLEFHPTDDHLLVSGGHDKVAKLFDIRMMHMDDSDRNTNVATFEHDGILNAAKFSKLAPHHLLTTTQSSKCNVFDVKNLDDSRPIISLSHPHRPFQHLTPIVANWHPVVPSTFVIGRYPEKDSDRRTVDVYQMNGDNIRCVARLEDPRVNGIQCISKFNRTGEMLSTCSGFTTFLWDPLETEFIESSSKKRENTSTSSSKPTKKLHQTSSSNSKKKT